MNMIKKSLKKVFIETFEPTMIKNGFLRKDKIFHRIVNGKIVQLLSFYKYSGSEFTIQFSIEPLCCDGEYSTFMDDLRVDEVFRDIEPWEYEHQTDGFVEYMPEALKVTEELLFPLFDLIVDYTNYLEEINNLYPFPLPIFDNSIYMMNMVLGDYEKSKESKETRINNRISANQRRWGTNNHIDPVTQAKFEQECEEYYRIKEAMDSNDREYIDQYIHEQEQKSLRSYVKAFSTPKKYKIFLETGVLPFEFVLIPECDYSAHN